MVVMWVIKFTKNAEKDKDLLKRAGLANKAKTLLNLIAINPYQTPPSYEKLVGDLAGYYSRRININKRFITNCFIWCISFSFKDTILDSNRLS